MSINFTKNELPHPRSTEGGDRLACTSGREQVQVGDESQGATADESAGATRGHAHGDENGLESFFNPRVDLSGAGHEVVITVVSLLDIVGIDLGGEEGHAFALTGYDDNSPIWVDRVSLKHETTQDHGLASDGSYANHGSKVLK